MPLRPLRPPYLTLRWLKKLLDLVESGGPSPIQTATVTLTDAQILALPDTRVQLLAAPAAGKVNVPISIAIVTSFTTGYACDPWSQNDNFLVRWAEGPQDIARIVSLETNLFVESLLSFTGTRLSLMQVPDLVVDGLNGIATPVIVSANVSGLGAIDVGLSLQAPLSGGNAANAMKIIMEYRTLDLATMTYEAA